MLQTAVLSQGQEAWVQAKDYISLAKPRVSLVVTLTALAGMAASPAAAQPIEAAVSMFALFCATGASGAFNMWAERDSDALMKRTANRPIPSGRIQAQSALEFSVLLGVLSLVLMFLSGGLQATCLLIASMFIYCYIYTIKLKKTSVQNIVIGGLSGALPPMIGWAASGANAFSALPILMTLTIFMWTPAHFWALAVARSEEYKKASIPMLPCVKSRETSAVYIAAYTVLTVISGTMCALFMSYAWLYVLLHSMIAVCWCYTVTKFYLKRSDKYAMSAFGVSVLYIALICLIWSICA